jgi:dTDP-4-dehydrorhamnose reductase
MSYIGMMRLLVIGDTPLCNRLRGVFVRYFDSEEPSGLQIRHPDENILATINTFRPDVIVNGAFVESETGAAFAENSRDPATFALYARMVGAQFYHLSDSSVFHTGKPRDDENPYPARVYGLSRLLGERAIMNLHPKATIVRTSWLYGPELPESPPMVAWAQKVGEKTNAHVYDDLEVSPTFIGDAAQMLGWNILSSWIRLEGHPEQAGRTYHLGPAGSSTWYDYLLPRFPNIQPLKSNRLIKNAVVHRNVSITPSPGWVIEGDSLGRFTQEMIGLG